MLCEFQKLIYPKTRVGLTAGSYMIALYTPCEKLRDRQGHLLGSVKAVGYGLPLSANLRYKCKGVGTTTQSTGFNSKWIRTRK